MSKIISGMFVFLSLMVNLFPQPVFAADERNPAADAEALRKDYVAFLETQGYRGRVDRDGDVGFMCEGQYYFIQIEPDAPKFFRLVLASDWKIDSEKDRLRIIQAAEYATRVTKGAKVFLVNNRIWVTVEQFVPDKGGYKKIFFLSMEALKNGMLAFLEKMNELKK